MSHAKIWQLWHDCYLDFEHRKELARCMEFILKNYDRYKAVGEQVGIPAAVIACLHYRESSFDFKKHLANGDPLFDGQGNGLRTVHEPKDLGPFKDWEEGALAAIKHKGMDKGWHWDVVNTLENLEAWNGFGYRKHDVNSPYIWSGTSEYDTGLYVSDGTFNPFAKDLAVGCAAILKALTVYKISLKEIPPISVT